MRPLRFCHLTTFYPPHSFGGDGIGIERLCRALARRGHQVHVVYDADAYRALSGGKDPLPAPDPDGIVRTPLRSRAGKLSLLLTQQLGRPVVHGPAIAKLLREGDFDVINFHNASLVGGPGLFSYGSGVKLYMAHEHWLVCASHVLFRYGREPCTSRDCLRCVLAHKRPPQPWRYTGMLRRQGRHIDAFIAMSDFSRRKHAEYGFPFDMEVLPYFLPDPASGDGHAAPSDASPHDRPFFLFVGRLELIKGLQEVIPLFERYPDADLLVAGDGEYGQVLRGIARGNPRVKFLGRVPPSELDRYYRHALSLIVPSMCFETFGIILIEAFRQRTPVIARRIGPLPEVVASAQAGELFETPEQLLSAMRTLQHDPALRARYAAAGHEAYLAHYCERQVLPRYLDILRRAAQRKGDARVLQALA